jgi:predicted Zn-dependent peptidase
MQPHTALFDPYDFTHTKISSVPIYWKHIPSAPCIHIQITFFTGAYSDPVGKEGLSHFLEHMIFDGSPEFPDKKAIKEWQKKYTLNSWNASTGHYSTTYRARCLPEHYESMLSGIQNMIFLPFIRPEDTEHERQVITQEAWQKYHNEKLLAYTRHINSQVFPKHTLSRIGRPLGWPETIATISTEDIRDWHTRWYTKQNMCIVLAGNIDISHVDKLDSFVDNAPDGKKQTTPQESIPLPLMHKVTKYADEIGLVKEQAEISISCCKNIPDTPEEYGHAFRHVFQDILHEKLRDEQSACYGVHVSVRRTVDYINYIVNIETSEKHIDVVKKEIANQIHLLTQTDTYRKRFDQMQQVAIDHIRSEERRTENIISRANNDVVYAGKISTLADTLSSRAQVTYRDIQTVGMYLSDPDYMVTEIILPSRKE